MLVAERSETVIKETLPANRNSPGSSVASDAVRLRELEVEERRREREYEERRESEQRGRQIGSVRRRRQSVSAI